MKANPDHQSVRSSRVRLVQAAHTLTEVMIASGLFSLLIIGLLGCHFAGLRFAQFIQPKLLHAQYNRQTISRLIDEVRSANSVQVGTGTLSTFTATGANGQQAGNALRIYPGTNLTQFIYYYHDASTLNVQRVPLGSTNAATIATDVTNHTIFR